MKTVSKFQLINFFMNRTVCKILDSNGKPHSGIISSIQHEDGSGKSFNISMGNDTFHLRTID